jgi:hypothetical protein
MRGLGKPQITAIFPNEYIELLFERGKIALLLSCVLDTGEGI